MVKLIKTIVLILIFLAGTSFIHRALALTTSQVNSSLTPSGIVAPQTQLTYTTTFNNSSYGVITGVGYTVTVYSSEYLPLTFTLPPGVTCTVGTLVPDFTSYKYTCTPFSVPSRSRMNISATLNSYTSVPNSGTILKITSVAKSASTTASVSVQNLVPDLKLASTAYPYTVEIGQQINYQVVVSNIGSGVSPETTMLITYPDGTTQTETVPSLNTNTYITFNFSFIPSVVPTNGYTTTSFSVDPDNTVPEVSESNNYMDNSNQVLLGMPDLLVTSVDDPSTVASNSSFVRTIVVTNIGDIRASTESANPVSVRDSFSYMSVESISGDHGLTCIPTFYPRGDGASGSLCYGGSINPGESATITEVINTYYPILTNDSVDVNVTYNPYSTNIIESNYTNNNFTHTITIQ